MITCRVKCGRKLHIHPKLQRLPRWSFGMDKWFHLTHYVGCNYLFILGFKFNHVNKRDSWYRLWYHARSALVQCCRKMQSFAHSSISCGICKGFGCALYRWIYINWFLGRFCILANIFWRAAFLWVIYECTWLESVNRTNAKYNALSNALSTHYLAYRNVIAMYISYVESGFGSKWRLKHRQARLIP